MGKFRNLVEFVGKFINFVEIVEENAICIIGLGGWMPLLTNSFKLSLYTVHANIILDVSNCYQ